MKPRAKKNGRESQGQVAHLFVFNANNTPPSPPAFLSVSVIIVSLTTPKPYPLSQHLMTSSHSALFIWWAFISIPFLDNFPPAQLELKLNLSSLKSIKFFFLPSVPFVDLLSELISLALRDFLRRLSWKFSNLGSFSSVGFLALGWFWWLRLLILPMRHQQQLLLRSRTWTRSPIWRIPRRTLNSMCRSSSICSPNWILWLRNFSLLRIPPISIIITISSLALIFWPRVWALIISPTIGGYWQSFPLTSSILFPSGCYLNNWLSWVVDSPWSLSYVARKVGLLLSVSFLCFYFLMKVNLESDASGAPG